MTDSRDPRELHERSETALHTFWSTEKAYSDARALINDLDAALIEAEETLVSTQLTVLHSQDNAQKIWDRLSAAESALRAADAMQKAVDHLIDREMSVGTAEWIDPSVKAAWAYRTARAAIPSDPGEP